MPTPRILLIGAILIAIVAYFSYRALSGRKHQREFEQSLESTRAQLEQIKQSYRKPKKAKK